MFLELLLVEEYCWWVVENLKFWVGKDCDGLNPTSFWVWEGGVEHGLGSFGKVFALKEVVEAGAELRSRNEGWRMEDIREQSRGGSNNWLVWMAENTKTSSFWCSNNNISITLIIKKKKLYRNFHLLNKAITDRK